LLDVNNTGPETLPAVFFISHVKKTY